MLVFPHFAALLSLALVCVDGHPSQCRHAEAEDTSCRAGWVKDPCGNTVCGKGPGDICGGKDRRYGTCAKGLFCSNCHRCQGCSYRTFTCYDDLDCIW